MLEKEVKVLEIDRDLIISRLESLGARLSFAGRVETYYFDYLDGRFKTEGKILRIRKLGDVCYLDLKKQHKPNVAGKTLPNDTQSSDGFGRVKVNEEIRVGISNPNELLTILNDLGLNVVAHLIKYRTSYMLGDVVIEIDEMEGIPTYMEIEGEEEDIFKTIKLLGLDRNKVVNFTSDEVLKYYGKN